MSDIDVIEFYEVGENDKLLYKDPMEFAKADFNYPTPQKGDVISLLHGPNFGVYEVVRRRFGFFVDPKDDKLNGCDVFKRCSLMIYVKRADEIDKLDSPD